MRELFARQLDILQGRTKPAAKPAPKPQAEVKGLYKRLDTGQAAERPAAQTAHLKRLTAAYNARTRGSKEHTAEHRAHFANSRSVIGFRREWKELIYPLTVARAEGARVWDVDGNEYVDVTMGFGALLFGHAPDFVRQALKDEIDRGMALGPQRTLAGEVAERIHEMTGCERVAFFTTGTEAVMVAVRVARSVTGRDRIAIFSNSYHGSFDSLLATGWVDDEGATTVPIAAGTPQSLVDDVLVLPYGDPRSLEILRARAGELAAVLVEPVQSREPTVQPREFLRELREITRESGAALLFDEMIVGFRCHPGGAQAWFGVEADLVTYGKVLGGGMPIGVLAGKRRFLDAVDGGPWTYGDGSVPESYTAFVAGTYNGHPLAMAAALAVLDRLRDEGPGLQERLNRRTERFLAELNGFFEAEEVPIRVAGFSSLFRFVMSGDAELLNYHLLANGVFVWEGRNCFLSAAHTDEDVQHIVDAVKRSVAAMRRDGWLPARPEPVRLRLARAQQEMWFLIQSEPGAALAYHEMLALDLTGRLDPDALRAALRRLAARHAALRTVSIREDGQTLAPSLEIPLTVSGEESLETALAEPFDLSAGPLFRARLLRRSDERWALLLVAHHLIADGWSLGLIGQELLALYMNQTLPPASQPADFLTWERERAATKPAGAPLLDEPFPALELPGPPRRGYEGARLHLREQELYDEVRRFSRAYGVSAVMTFFAGWSLLLARLSGQSRFVVGVPYAGQLEMGAESLVGQCSVLLPVPVVVNLDQPFAAFLDATRQRLLASYEKTGRLFSALDLEEVSRIPRINVIFNMDRPVSLEMPGIAVDLLPVPVRSAKFDLFLNVMELDGRALFDVDFNGRFDEPTVAGWVEHLFALLRRAMAKPDAALAELVAEIPQPAPRISETAIPSGGIEPRNDLEAALCRIWGAALGTNRVGVTDDFLALGGHSLKAVHILARIESELGLRFTIRDLFERPTVAELAALAAGRRRSWEPIPALPPASRYPVSHAQLRLWMLDQMEPGLIAYNIPFAIVFEEEVDREALRRALRALAARHETLRTRFVAEDGLPFQIVDAPGAELGEVADVSRPFDLATGPLWRVDLCGSTLVCNLHHVISDVWSLGIFVSELLTLYRADDAALAPLPIQYRDFAAWQRQRTVQEDLDYWRGKLGGGLVPVTYPTDFERPAQRTYNGASHRFEIEGARLRSFCRARGVSLFMALAAAMKAQLHALTGQEDVVLGSVIAGRDHPDTAGLIGFFVNNLALRDAVRPDDSFDTLLGRVRQTVLEAFEHAGLPWDEVVDQLRVPRDPSRNPVFDVVLVMDDREDADALSKEFGVSIVEMETPTAQFDLTLYVTDGPDRIRFSAVYNTDLYRPETVARYMEELRRILAGSGLRVPSYHQERLWFVDRFETGTLYPAQPVYYNMPLVARLSAPLDLARLDAAVGQVAARHEALRMRLVTEGDRPAVRIAEGRPTVEVVEQSLEERIERPFDLERDVLWRVELIDQELLLLVAHHAIADHAALRQVLEELMAIYEGRPPGDPGIPFGEMARRQKADRDAAIARDLPYWREQLAGLTALELPTDRSRPAIHLYKAAVVDFDLPLAGGEAGMLAVFHALLHRYSGQDDVVTGVIDRPEGVRCVGPLTDYLVLRSSFADAPSLRDLTGRLSILLEGARAHRSLPFDELVLQLRPRNDMSRTALFDVLFRFETGHDDLEMNRGWGKFDLNLCVRESRGVMTYNAELFDRATIERMLGHFRRLAEAAPDTPVRDLPLLSAEEEAQLAAGQAPSPFPHRTLHEIFEERAAADPDAIALTLGTARMTYGELNARANRLARRLRSLGVGPGALVGIHLDRSFDLIAAVLGILKAGGAYVPLDPEYPERRVAFMVEDAGLRWVVTDAFLAETADLDPSNLPPAASPEDPCYVIYTSGSSGKPKGVIVEHRNVASLLFHEGSPFDFGPADVWTLFHSPCFDFSVWEMYGALLFGGRLVIVPRETARDTAAFRRLLAAERVTVLNQTPAAFYALMQEDETYELRWVVFGGEKLLPAKLAPWRGRHPGCRLVNMYGITETTVHVTFKELADGDLAGSQSLIGRPLASVSTWIVDAYGRLQPVGVPGEVLVGGHGVARGYLNREELTAERFLPHPFGGEGRVYRSGDLAKLRADGELIYLGRIDQQIKVRGFRVEPGEIEAQLLSHDAVREAVVTVREDRLEAWLILEGDLTLEEMLGFLGERLPEHMIPGRFFRIAAVPMTGNGKVDRAALARLEDAEELGTAAGYVAPRTPGQRVLAGIWQEVLQRDRVGMTDNFFELGGHSLKANQAVARIRRRLERDVSLKDFFSAPHLAALAEMVSARPRLACGAIEPVPPAEHHPLSFSQRRLWVLHQVEPESVAYNMVGVYHLTGDLDVAGLRNAFRALVDRHESLRTTFRKIAGEPRQVIAPRGEEEVLSLLADGSPTEVVQRELEHAFDLETGPLVRARLLRLPEPQHLLVVNLHHVICDGWSVAVLIRELMALYSGAVLPPLRIQYKDYAAWQLSQPPGRQRDFWLGQFQDGVPALDLPTDRERPARRSGRGALVSRVLGEELSAALRDLALQQRTTLFAVLTAALQVLLFRLTGQRDLVIGTPVAGRGHVDLENQVGFYLNLLGLRGRLATADTVRRLLDRTTDMISAAFENQDYPYDLLVEDLGRNPLFDVLLILQNNEPVRLELDRVRVEELPDRSVSSKYDLNFMFEDRPALELKIEYGTDLFDAGTVAALAEDFIRLTAAMAADPDVRLHELRDRLAGSAPEEQQAFLASALDLGGLDPEGW
jgi:amino acid adenylation domain-containing protein